MNGKPRRPVRRSRLVLLLALATAMASCRKEPAKKSGPILIGLVGALSGPEAELGQSIRDGALLAIEQANAQGGVRGRPLELRAYDSQGRPEEAARAAVRLVSQDGAVLIVGADTSGSTLAMAPVAARAQVPLISPTATSPRVTAEGGPYVFRVCFVDSFQGTALANLARDEGFGRMAVLSDVKSDYSVGLAHEFEERYLAIGGTLVGKATYAQGDSDFRAQLTRLKGLRPEALFIPGYYADAASIALQARQLGLLVPLLGGDGWDSVTALVALGGQAVEGSQFTTHFSPDNPSPSVQSFLRAFQTRFAHPPPSGSALGYDAARVGLEALRNAPAPGGPALRDAVARTASFDGVTGLITLGQNRDAVKSAVVVRIRGGRAAFVTELSPEH
jgi:branched-chain amino acid transport system substrate-binding protein